MKQLMKTIAKTLPLLLLAVGAAFILPEIAQAAEAADTQKTVEQSIASLLSIGMQFLNALLWPFLIIIGDLMDTDLILGPGMEERLKGIWIPVRDLVNIGFVLVLLVVAFYNVLGIGGGEGDLALKTALPKIVLGLVLVNFTFIGGKVVLDLVNVATTAVFALPELAAGDETPYDFSAIKEEFRQNVCYKSVDENGTAVSWTAATEEDEKDIPIHTRLFCEKADDGTYDELDGLLAAQYFTDLNVNNIGLVMAVNMGGLSSLSVLDPEGIESFSDLSISIMFAVAMYLVFAASYLVLGIVLLTRLIVLWIALALSPLAVLVYVVPQIKEWAGGGGDFAQKIVKHLLAPVIIGATMSLGYIMISAWDGLTGNSALDGGGFQVDQVISTEFLVSGIDDLPQFIIALASIVIVWTGVFAAASDTYASFATDAIKGFGERVRDAALKAPTLIPSIPIGVKDGQQQTASFAALKGLADAGLRQIEYGAPAEAEMQKLAEGNPIAKMLLGGTRTERDPTKNLKDVSDILATANNGTLQGDKAAELANRLYGVFSEKYKGNDKDQVLRDLGRIQKDFTSGTDTERGKALEDLKTIAAKSDEGLKGLGTMYSNENTKIQNLREVTPATPTGGNAPTGEPTGPTTAVTATGGAGARGAATSAPTPASIAGIIAPASTLGTGVAGLTGGAAALPPATGTAIGTLDTNITEARARLGDLQTTPNAANLTAARGAVTTALTQARAVQTDANVQGDATLLGHANTTVTQLEEMDRQLTGLTV